MKRPARFLLPATVTLLFAAGALWSARLATRYQRQLQVQPSAVARWEQHIRQSREQRDALLRRLDAARQNPTTSAAPAEPVADSLDLALATEIDRWVRQVQRLKQAFAQRPDQKIPELAVLDDRDWLRRARMVKLDTEDNLQRAFAIMRNQAKSTFVQWMLNAMNRYVKENQGQLPTDPAELGRYFNPTLDPAIFAQYEMVRSGPLSDAPEGPVLKLKTTVNDDYDDRISITRKADSSLTYGSARNQNPATPPTANQEMKRDAENAVRAFIAANHGALPASPAQLLPFFDPPLGPLMTERLSQPMTDEDRKKFQDDMAKLKAGHPLSP